MTYRGLTPWFPSPDASSTAGMAQMLMLQTESLHITVAIVRKINAVLACTSWYSMEIEVALHKQLGSPLVETVICEKRFWCLVR